jgi:phosphoribosylanthranilate isomerase
MEAKGRVTRRPKVKVCGLTDPGDACLAAELGADYFGFIFFSRSPRALDVRRYRAIRDDLPSGSRVFVQVRPTTGEVEEALAEGFEFLQLHFSPTEDRSLVEAWATLATPAKLWLAPRIAPDEPFPSELLAYAETFLIDTYREQSFGGTGETGDWGRFAEWSRSMPEKRWVLAGGLRPKNIASALAETSAAVVDVTSGIEERPGKKDPGRMRAFFAELDRLTWYHRD